MLRFLLNDTPVEEGDLPPDLTVLTYLRDHRGLCGTKEGCASGDCGACTAVVASVVNDRLRYQSINTCIAFVGSLHGCQLITVEHLATKDSLHPAQQAMVDCHGSQCGFCTPGFVMSIFALTKNMPESVVEREIIDEYLGGNLCRCTGYRPIVDAAKTAVELSSLPDKFSVNEKNTVALLDTLMSAQQGSEQKRFTRNGSAKTGTANSDSRDYFFRPQSIQQACEFRADYPQAAVLAGGTDLALLVTQQHGRLPQIISLQDIDQLTDVTCTETHWCIGAACKLADFQRQFESTSADVHGLLKRFGSTQIRNRGTVGGNIVNASPVGDLPPLLIALDAELVLQSATAQRVLGIEEFFIDYKKIALQPDELLVEIRIPRSSLEKYASADKPVLKVFKISKRIDDDISAALAVFNLTLTDGKIESARIAFGGMAAVPKRAHQLEHALTGKRLSEEVLRDADKALSAEFQPITDARASDWYRLQVCKNLLRRLAVEIDEPALRTRVADYVG